MIEDVVFMTRQQNFRYPNWSVLPMYSQKSSGERFAILRYNCLWFVFDLSLICLLSHLTSRHLMNNLFLYQLCKHLPARAEGYAWTLIYSSSKHGFSLKTMYREMIKYETPVLLVIEDTFGTVSQDSIYNLSLINNSLNELLFDCIHSCNKCNELTKYWFN